MAGGILFFSSPIGLGHATRDAAIAGALLDEEVGGGGRTSVRLASGGTAARLHTGLVDSARQQGHCAPL